MKTKYASQTAAKPSWKSAILLAITALVLCAAPAVALGNVCPAGATCWTDSTGSWFTDGNWSNHVPTSTIDAYINNGGFAQIYLQTPSASAKSLTLGDGISDSGTVGVGSNNYGTLAVGDTIVVANKGTGTLKIASGGTATSAGASIAAQSGQLWTSNGSASVDGSSTWTVSGEVDVGGTTSSAGGTGLLSVTNGGTVSAGSSVHVWNSGTLSGNGTVRVNSGSGTVLVDGTLAPSGTLTISGNLRFNSSAANMRCNVSSTSVDNAQVSGIATLNGKLSVTVNATGDFTLLHAANGLNGSKFSSYSFTYTAGCLSASISYGSSDVILHVVSTCN
jgi:hypothetical protein